MHEMLRDSLRWGRRRRPKTTSQRKPVEVKGDDWRRPETWETVVVWLITQRSRVQIPPRYQGQTPSLEQRKGLWAESCKLIL